MDTHILEESERRHLKFMIGVFLTGSKVIEGCEMFWHDHIKDSYSNFASHLNTTQEKSSELVESLIKFYNSINRTPAIFITPFSKPKTFTPFLIKKGFTIGYKESWMFLDKTINIQSKSELEIRECKDDDVESFIEIFNKAYAGGDPKEPYGNLPPEYRDVIRNSFMSKNSIRQVRNYIGYYRNQAVSIILTCNDSEYAGLYALGTIPEMRGKGFGKAMMIHCVKELQSQGMKHIFLQTVADSYNEKLYETIGFKTEFVGECYVKN